MNVHVVLSPVLLPSRLLKRRLAFDMTSTEILARDGKGIQNQVDNSTGSNNGVAFNCVFNQTEKELVEKLIDSKDQIIEGLKREIELYKRKN